MSTGTTLIKIIIPQSEEMSIAFPKKLKELNIPQLSQNQLKFFEDIAKVLASDGIIDGEKRKRASGTLTAGNESRSRCQPVGCGLLI